MLFWQHLIFLFRLLTLSCSGHAMGEITGINDAVSQPVLCFLSEPENDLGGADSLVLGDAVTLLLCGVDIPGPRLCLLECTASPHCRLQLQAPGPWSGLQRVLHCWLLQPFGQVFLKDTVISTEQQPHRGQSSVLSVSIRFASTSFAKVNPS